MQFVIILHYMDSLLVEFIEICLHIKQFTATLRRVNFNFALSLPQANIGNINDVCD